MTTVILLTLFLKMMMYRGHHEYSFSVNLKKLPVQLDTAKQKVLLLLLKRSHVCYYSYSTQRTTNAKEPVSPINIFAGSIKP